ncbi:MAG TPA: pilus assembly protein TadG-related protein [Sphingomicrobium sp.]|nr:pilus assembly protein TadG-related protein [Sphingomicrobium sp.]
MRKVLRRLIGDDGGAVAPLVGLSLFALIACGGIAFDYARMAAMDTELQNAADQAALAAATQLDGTNGARDRANLAARNLISNSTLFANDGGEPAVAIDTLTFYVDQSKSTASTGDSDSNFVEVEVVSREARYALTPVVAAFSSGQMTARAFAGVGSAICGVVPFFICNPAEPVGNTDPYLSPGGVEPGTGIVMAEGGSQWGPGNFGFIDQIGQGANSVAEALASDSLYGNCSGTELVTTQTGNIINAVRDSLNMRFDFDPGNNAACKSGPCSPSTNVRKDVVRASTGCSWVENGANYTNYQTRRYRPSANAPLDSSITPQIMGHPRDICHSLGVGNYPCPNGRVGNGVWDRAAYFRANHPGVDWQNDPDLGPNATRYQTYLWEAEDVVARLTAQQGSTASGTGTAPQAYSTPQSGRCLAPGVSPDPAGIDRRRISAAVINCRRVSQTIGLNGKKTIPVAGFIDVFLVEPSIDRTRCDGNQNGCNSAYTHRNDIYIEVISASGYGQGGNVAQITRRDVPRLIE